MATTEGGGSPKGTTTSPHAPHHDYTVRRVGHSLCTARCCTAVASTEESLRLFFSACSSCRSKRNFSVGASLTHLTRLCSLLSPRQYLTAETASKHTLKQVRYINTARSCTRWSGWDEVTRPDIYAGFRSWTALISLPSPASPAASVVVFSLQLVRHFSSTEQGVKAAMTRKGIHECVVRSGGQGGGRTFRHHLLHSSMFALPSAHVGFFLLRLRPFLVDEAK